MKKLLSAVLLAAVASTSSGAASPPAGWPEVGAGVHLIPASVERFGSTLLFATLQQGWEPETWTVSWRWAHCQGGWVTDLVAMDYGLTGTAEAAFNKAGLDQRKFFTAPLEYQPLASLPFGDGAALRRQVASRCKLQAASQQSIELPVAGTDRNVGREGHNDYLLLKTIVRKGEQVEGWMRRRPISVEEVKRPDGSILRKEDGTAWTKEVFTAHTTSARFKVTADCSRRYLAMSRFVAYDKNGDASNSSQDDGKLQFSEPIPGTLGEAYVDVLCRL